jgi:AraC-like DNA-binding protein
MDVLSDVLRLIHLRGAVFFTADMAGRWAVESPDRKAVARLLRIQEACVALFHLVVEGRCTVALGSGEGVTADAGSIVILPRGDTHRLGTDLSLEPMRVQSIMYSGDGPEIPYLKHGSGDSRTRLICGYLRCDQQFNPLMGALPALLVDHPADGRLDAEFGPGGPAPIRAQVLGHGDGWLGRTFTYVVEEAEARRPGSAVMLPRLAELMYIEVLRRYMQLLPAEGTGWLAAARDPRVGQALRLLHEQPARNWEVAALAREVGVSRSVLGERFQSLVGEPPMRYLARWRMHMAERLLTQPDLSVAEVAARVGFESSVAFHRAFKRHAGQTPVEWRAARVNDVG